MSNIKQLTKQKRAHVSDYTEVFTQNQTTEQLDMARKLEKSLMKYADKDGYLE